jgi:hypothetical protein
MWPPHQVGSLPCDCGHRHCTSHPPIHAWVLQVFCFLMAFLPNFCAHFDSPHAYYSSCPSHLYDFAILMFVEEYELCSSSPVPCQCAIEVVSPAPSILHSSRNSNCPVTRYKHKPLFTSGCYRRRFQERTFGPRRCV